MSYRRKDINNKFTTQKSVIKPDLGWLTQIFDKFVMKKSDKIPNLYSTLNLASIQVNAQKKEDRVVSVRKLLEKLTIYSDYSKNKSTLEVVNERLNQIKSIYCSLQFSVLDVMAKLRYRGLVVSSSSFGQPVFEVGLAFDPLLNVPYIPGSSFKGAVRAACISKNIFSGDEKLFKELLGDGSVGRLEFVDAYPVEGSGEGYLLLPDVMTPHYSKKGEDIFGEDQVKVTPIPFLSIAPHTVFRFLIADRKGETDLKLINKVLKAVAVAFSLGIGAKTSVGYGVFELVNASIEKGGRNADG